MIDPELLEALSPYLIGSVLGVLLGYAIVFIGEAWHRRKNRSKP